MIVGGNQILVGAMRAARRHGLRLPEDVSLVTCDETVLSEFYSPPLATITRDVGLMGKEAGAGILNAIAEGAPRRVLLPVVFEPNGSCARPPVKPRAGKKNSS
jgi:DNA-binding LacI/PurR family transcriptional regulator